MTPDTPAGPDGEPEGLLGSRAARALENHLGGADAANYRTYQLELIAPHLGARVLEVGAGLGEFAAQLRGLDRLVVSDTDPLCLAALRRRFADRAEVTVAAMDLDGSITLDAPVDTVLAMNVLEHIEDDVTALKELSQLLTPGGGIVLWVPAYPALYGDFDRLVGHFRRYTPATLRPVVEGAGLAVEVLHPVNLLGGLAWWAAVRLRGQGSADPRLVRLYDRFVVPATRRLERWAHPRFGQSLLCVARAH